MWTISQCCWSIAMSIGLAFELFLTKQDLAEAGDLSKLRSNSFRPYAAAKCNHVGSHWSTMNKMLMFINQFSASGTYFCQLSPWYTKIFQSLAENRQTLELNLYQVVALIVHLAIDTSNEQSLHSRSSCHIQWVCFGTWAILFPEMWHNWLQLRYRVCHRCPWGNYLSGINIKTINICI